MDASAFKFEFNVTSQPKEIKKPKTFHKENTKIAINEVPNSFTANKTQPAKRFSKPTKDAVPTKQRKQGGKPPQQHTRKGISAVGHTQVASLFHNNPQTPQTSMKDVQPTEETLFSKEKFDKLLIHPHLIGCLKENFSITTMTQVQSRSIPLLLQGKDALIKSLTGSGKTLAYALPLLHSLMTIEPKLDRSSGLRALVITPTRELAVQSYECLLKLSRACTWIVPGYLTGGEKRKSEKARLRKGITVLVSTPGRFLDHLEHTTVLSLENILWFVIDEADRLMDLGFEKSITQIETALREKNKAKRQTVLLSATLTQSVERLAGMSLKSPARVDIAATEDDSLALTVNSFAVPKKLHQRYIVVPMKLRLVALTALLVAKPSKILVFMATQDLVDFHYHLMTTVLGPMLAIAYKFFRLHGKLTQKDRVEIFQKFSEAETGVLICTDVASRGLDITLVEWIVQYSASQRAEDYVHRVGRTARIGSTGNALLFLLPSENGYLEFLGKHNLKLKGMDLATLLEALTALPFGKKTATDCASALQLKFEEAVMENKELHDFAHKAYISYLRAYAGYQRSMIAALPFKELHLGHAAKSLCLREKPSDLGSSFGPNARKQNSRPNKLGIAKRKRRSGSPDKGMNKRPRIMKPKKRAVSEFDSGI